MLSQQFPLPFDSLSNGKRGAEGRDVQYREDGKCVCFFFAMSMGGVDEVMGWGCFLSLGCFTALPGFLRQSEAMRSKSRTP